MKFKKQIKFILTLFKKGIKNRMKQVGFFLEVVRFKKDLKICPICDSRVGFNKISDFYLDKFQEHELVYSINQFETLNIENYKCKKCGASDRDRLISLYLKKFFKNNESKACLLDFAPSKPLFHFVKNLNINYRSADLYMEDVDDIVDIRDMKIYEDNTFDIFICSHILEHIDKDIKAMNELYRITKKNGVGICLVPIVLGLQDSVEHKKYLESEHLRWKYFGQDDHVRMYSKKDFVDRLKSTGFKVNQYGSNYFGKTAFELAGINKKSVLYVVEKK
ncbi:methyltransferase domain-containing protein [Tamlana flava]|uniref:methyltransferase domain-containing protein n=1 Tax=Tamlana flava TaxID=3158572 RepID=UPI00351AE6ED